MQQANKGRPLFHENTKELEVMARHACAEGDLKKLKSVGHELKFRSSKQAGQLEARVRAAIARGEDALRHALATAFDAQLSLFERETAQKEHMALSSPALRDVVLWLDSVAENDTEVYARALRERIKICSPEFARFAAEREGGETK